MRFENPYEILGLTPEASLEEVKAACEKLQQEPDKKEQAEAALAQILEQGEQPASEAPVEGEAAEEKPEAPAEEAEPADEKTEAPAEEAKPAEKEEKKKATPGQLALGIVSIVILAAVLVALILAAMDKKAPAEPAPAETVPAAAETQAPAETTEPTIPADGNPDDETCKGTYSGTDEQVTAAASNVVATMGDYKLTNGEFQIYYWMGVQRMVQNNPYLPYMGLDLSSGFDNLDSQVCTLAEGRTWQQFFVASALADWHVNQAMVARAEEEGYALPAERAEMLANLTEEMEKQAKEAGFDSALALLQNNVGVGAVVDDYYRFAHALELGQSYYSDYVKKQVPDDAGVESYYAENEEKLLENGISKDNKVASVRHILISPEDQESEDSWKQAEQKAQEILKEFESGDKTAESFGKLASQHTMDPGSKETGGLYEDFIQGQMVPEFDQWSFDAARKPGETGIVKTDFGYHIMYFVGTRPVWQEQVSQFMLQETAETFLEKSMESHKMDVDYTAIVLGNLKAAG